MTATTLHGSCLCGAVRYEVAGDPKRFFHCHCSRCRKATGTGHASNLFVQPGALKWLSGEEHLRSFKVPEAQRFTNTFCAVCGSRLPRQAPGTDVVAIPAGSLDEEPPLRGRARVTICQRTPSTRRPETGRDAGRAALRSNREAGRAPVFAGHPAPSRAAVPTAVAQAPPVDQTPGPWPALRRRGGAACG